MQIDEKMQQEGPKMMQKLIKNRSLGVGKSRKMGSWGASWSQVGPSWRQVGHQGPFLIDFVKNWSQDGGQNPLKIDEKSMQNSMIFSIGFWMHFGRDVGAKMDEKSMPKWCQKHVGIDLEVELAKT